MTDEASEGAGGREPTGEAAETARAYYEAIDAGDYDRFADLLASAVVHERPDRTTEGRETLVEFMREGRPNKDTSHEISRLFGPSDGTVGSASTGADVAVEGRLLDADGDAMFAFVDVFSVADGRIERIRTYTG